MSFPLLDRVALHVSQQVAPLLALRRQGFVPALQSRFFRVTPGAKHLQIAERIGEVRMRPDRLDVVHLKAMPRTALDAGPAVAVQGLHPQGLPAGAARDVP